ncbi:MAG: transcriptional regulator [Spirochaetes bacterium]|nr:transcriptional regulator [Spirochaetota bacterium]
MNKIKEIVGVIAKTKDEKIIENFLISLFTKKELERISSRWELVKLLNRGMPQRKISEKLGLSLCKITRGSKELKMKGSPFKHMIEIYEKSLKKNKK